MTSSAKGTGYEVAYRVEENEDGELVVVIMAGTRENSTMHSKHILDKTDKKNAIGW
jgi:mRNA interferase RelE/StbE